MVSILIDLLQLCPATIQTIRTFDVPSSSRYRTQNKPTHITPLQQVIDSKEQFATLVSFLGSLVALFGLLQSQAALVVAGSCCAAVAIGALTYSRQSRKRLQSAAISIEGMNIDSLNVANLRRRLNRSLVVQSAYHLAQIEGSDLTVAWHYSGFCKSKQESSMEFSIDSEKNISFDELDCFAFDLQEDPARLHRIRPLLIGGAGISKKVAVPFLKPLSAQDPFSVLLHCNLPGTLAQGEQFYYTSTLSFAQRKVKHFAVHLVFIKHAPEWVRVYECDDSGRAKLINHLHPFKNDGDRCEYVDSVEDIAGQAVRIYVFRIKDFLLPHQGLPQLPRS